MNKGREDREDRGGEAFEEWFLLGCYLIDSLIAGYLHSGCFHMLSPYLMLYVSVS